MYSDYFKHLQDRRTICLSDVLMTRVDNVKLTPSLDIILKRKRRPRKQVILPYSSYSHSLAQGHKYVVLSHNWTHCKIRNKKKWWSGRNPETQYIHNNKQSAKCIIRACIAAKCAQLWWLLRLLFVVYLEDVSDHGSPQFLTFCNSW